MCDRSFAFILHDCCIVLYSHNSFHISGLVLSPNHAQTAIQKLGRLLEVAGSHKLLYLCLLPSCSLYGDDTDRPTPTTRAVYTWSRCVSNFTLSHAVSLVKSLSNCQSFTLQLICTLGVCSTKGFQSSISNIRCLEIVSPCPQALSIRRALKSTLE